MATRYAAIFVIVLVTVWATLQAGSTASAQDGYRVAIDANLENGVCTTVDGAVSVAQGSSFQVAVCLINPAEPPDAFQIHMRFDRDKLDAPEVPDEAPALDDNPDANAGGTTFGGETLGTGWDCTAFGVQMPTMDSAHSESADPLIVCNANIATPDTQLRTVGAMAVLTFEAREEGEAEIELLPDIQIAGASRTVYSCGEIPSQTVRCEGARVFIGEEVPEEFEPTPSSEQPTPGAGSLTPGATDATPANPGRATAVAATAEALGTAPDDDDEDGGGNWLVIAVAAAAAALALVGGGWWYLRRQ